MWYSVLGFLVLLFGAMVLGITVATRDTFVPLPQPTPYPSVTVIEPTVTTSPAKTLHLTRLAPPSSSSVNQTLRTTYGYIVAISGDGNTLVTTGVGPMVSGHFVNIFYTHIRSANGDWQEGIPTTGPQKSLFGMAAVLNDDGTLLAIYCDYSVDGSPPMGGSPCVQVYAQDTGPGTWKAPVELLMDEQGMMHLPPARFPTLHFANNNGTTELMVPVMMASDSKVADNGNGAIFTFSLNAGTGVWTLISTLYGPANGHLGAGCAVSHDAQWMAAYCNRTTPTTSLITVYQRSGATWVEEATFTPPNESGTAPSLAFSGDGSTLLVGVPQLQPTDYVGTNYIYRKVNNVWTGTEVQGAGAAYDVPNNIKSNQGYSVALSRDGTTFISGAPADSSMPVTPAPVTGFTYTTGAIWIFNEPVAGAGFVDPFGKLYPGSNTIPNRGLNTSIDSAGTNLVFSALDTSSGANVVGYVYVYEWV